MGNYELTWSGLMDNHYAKRGLMLSTPNGFCVKSGKHHVMSYSHVPSDAYRDALFILLSIVGFVVKPYSLLAVVSAELASDPSKEQSCEC